MNLAKQNAGTLKTVANGFTLIELMIAVVIVGILAAIAYPSYRQYVVKSNRSAAESFMLTISNKEEQYVLDKRSYATGAGALTTLNLSPPPEVSDNYNDISVAPGSTPLSYIITATPKGAQEVNDTQCKSLTLDQTGAKGSSPGSVSTCW